MLTVRILLILPLLLLSALVCAQNTGGVFGPKVNPDHQSFSYRFTVDPDMNNNETGFAQRVHYQRSMNDVLRWRVVGQSIKTASSNTDVDFVQAELTWELKNEGRFASGVRFDVRVRNQDRPHQVGINWTNQFQLNTDWYARAILLTSVQLGDNATSGISLQTRSNLVYVSDYGNFGMELFNSYGNTQKIRAFDKQNHTIGPFWSSSVGNNGWSLFVGSLFGVTDSSPDVAFRFWIAKRL